MIVAIILFLSVTVIFGIYNRPKSAAEYLILSRSVPALGVAAATFTLIGGGEFMSLTSLSYSFGFWAIVFFAGVIAGFIILAFLSKRARDIAEAEDLHSLPDFLHYKYGNGIAKISTILNVAALGSLLIIQFVVGGQIISAMTNLPLWVGVVMMCASVCVYLYFSGFRGVLATDIFQAAVMFVATGIIAWFAIAIVRSQGLSFSGIFHSSPINFADAVMFVLTGLGGILGGGDVWQRIFAAKNHHEARKGLLLNALGWFVFGIIFIVLAVGIRGLLPDADPNTAFLNFIQAGLPPMVEVILAFLVLAAVISTADVEMYVLSILISKEIRRGQSLESVALVKVALIAVALISAVVAVATQNLIQIYIIALSLLYCIAPLVLATLLGRGDRLTAYVSILSAVAILIYLIATQQLIGAKQLLLFIPAFIPFLVSEKKYEHNFQQR